MKDPVERLIADTSITPTATDVRRNFPDTGWRRSRPGSSRSWGTRAASSPTPSRTPKSPPGRKARTAMMSRKKITSGTPDVVVQTLGTDSITPTMSPPAKAPGRLVSPPMREAASARMRIPMPRRPESRDCWAGTMRSAASPARPPAAIQVKDATRRADTPRS